MILSLFCFVVNIPYLVNSKLIKTSELSNELEIKCNDSGEMSTKFDSVLDYIFNFLVPFLIPLIFSVLTVKIMIEIKKNDNITNNNLQAINN